VRNARVAYRATAAAFGKGGEPNVA
jgi:hypothetical protein